MVTLTSLQGRSTRLSDRAIWWAAFAVVAALGLLWAVSSPLMAVPDEPNHTLKAVALYQGELSGRDVTTRSDDPKVVSGTVTYFTEDRTWDVLRYRAACYAFQFNTPAGCMPVVTENHEQIEIPTYAGNYPPMYYAIVGWPSLLLPAHIALFVMRAVSVLVAAALIASGLLSATRSRGAGGLIAGIALAVTPMTPFLIGAINPSGLEIAASFCLWLTALALASGTGPPSTRLLVRFVVALGLLAGCRPLSPAFAVFILVAVVAMAGSRTRLAELWADRNTRRAALAAVALLALAVLVVLVSGAVNSFSGTAQPGLTHAQAAQGSIGLITDRAQEMIGLLGWRDTFLPGAIPLIWLAAIGLLAIAALVLGSARQRLMLVLTTLGIVALPVVSEALKAPTLGYIWQARYSIPLAIGLPILSGWIVGVSGRLSARRLAQVASVAAVAAAVGLGVVHAIWMRRNVVGQNHPVLSYLGGTGWVPPLPTWVLGLAAVLVSIGWAGLLMVLARQPGAAVVAAPPPAAATPDPAASLAR